MGTRSIVSQGVGKSTGDSTKTFTDSAGRTWTIALDLGTALAVKDKLGLDLLQPETPYTGDLPGEALAREGRPLLTRPGTDELLLGEVLCALLAEQFDAHKAAAEDVRAGFDGATQLGFLVASGVMDAVPEESWIAKLIGGVVAVPATLGYSASRAKVWVKDADGEPVAGRMDLPEVR